MCFEKFITCTEEAVCLAWDETLIHGDVEAVDLALLTPNHKEVRLPTLLVAEMLLQTAAWLGLKYENWTLDTRMMYSQRENNIIEVIIHTSSHWLVQDGNEDLVKIPSTFLATLIYIWLRRWRDNYYNQLNNIITLWKTTSLSTASHALIFGDFSPPGDGGRRCKSNNREAISWS